MCSKACISEAHQVIQNRQEEHRGSMQGTSVPRGSGERLRLGLKASVPGARAEDTSWTRAVAQAARVRDAVARGLGGRPPGEAVDPGPVHTQAPWRSCGPRPHGHPGPMDTQAPWKSYGPRPCGHPGPVDTQAPWTPPGPVNTPRPREPSQAPQRPRGPVDTPRSRGHPQAPQTPQGPVDTPRPRGHPQAPWIPPGPLDTPSPSPCHLPFRAGTPLLSSHRSSTCLWPSSWTTLTT